MENIKKEICNHKSFAAKCEVSRLVKPTNKSDIADDYTMDVTVKCAECGMPFEFIGVPAGISFKHPTVSADFKELRVPIRPNTDSFATDISYDFPGLIEKTKNTDIN